MTDSHLPAAATTAAAVRTALREKNTALADRLITELFGRIINAAGEIPSRVFDEPDSTGDKRYDTLLAVGLIYALRSRGRSPGTVDGGGSGLETGVVVGWRRCSSPEYREYIRRQTPPLFLAKGLLLRERDLRIL